MLHIAAISPLTPLFVFSLDNFFFFPLVKSKRFNLMALTTH